MYFICHKYQLRFEHSEVLQRPNSSCALFRCVLLSYCEGDETIPPPLQGPVWQNINAGSTQCNKRVSGLPRIQTFSTVNLDFHPSAAFCEAPLFPKDFALSYLSNISQFLTWIRQPCNSIELKNTHNTT